MYIKLLDNAKEIREAFINRFVMPWDAFQFQHKEWISRMAENGYPITVDWYEKAFIWEKLIPDFYNVSMTDAIAFLKERSGMAYFITERGNTAYCQLVNFIAAADALILAERIAQEWYDDYRLAAQNMYNPNAIFPSEVYVFDSSMKWCVVFTHETTDWESELDNPMKAAESRVCFIFRQ